MTCHAANFDNMDGGTSSCPRSTSQMVLGLVIVDRYMLPTTTAYEQTENDSKTTEFLALGMLIGYSLSPPHPIQ